MMRNTPANNDQNLLELLSKQSCRLGLELLDRTMAGGAGGERDPLGPAETPGGPDRQIARHRTAGVNTSLLTPHPITCPGTQIRGEWGPAEQGIPHTSFTLVPYPTQSNPLSRYQSLIAGTHQCLEFEQIFLRLWWMRRPEYGASIWRPVAQGGALPRPLPRSSSRPRTR